MDKTIEIVVVAMVALIVATILLFLVQDRTENFSGFLNNQQTSAECDLWQSQYQTKVESCGGNTPASDFREAPSSSCSAPSC